MTSTSRALKRLGVVGVVAATIGAGVPVFFAAPASASHNGAPVTVITIAPPNDTAAVGTCNPYTVTVNAGANAAENTTVNAIVEEFTANTGTGNSTPPAGGTANDPATDVDFCTTATPANGIGGAAQPASFTLVSPDQGNAGQGDQAKYTTDANGQVVIGIISNNAGFARLTVYADQGQTPGGATNPGVNNNTLDAGEPVAYATKQFTPGGANSICGVDAAPNTAGNFVGETHTVLVTAYNDADTVTAGCQQGDPVTGINPSALVETSTNVTHAGDTLTCGSTGNNGAPALCTYSEPTTGTDTIRVYVNNTTAATGRTPNNTFEPAYEASDTVTKTWTTSSTNFTIDLTCGVAGQTTANGGRTSAEDCVDPTSDQNEVFQAVVKDTTGAPQAGVIVRFTHNGDADVTIVAANQGTAPSGATTADTQECITDAAGTCTATLTNTTPRSGQVVTVTATIRGQSGASSADSGTKTWKAAPNAARFISLGPDQTIQSGQSATFTALVTDVNGDPVQGVLVDFSNNGNIGQFAGAFRNTTATTDANGKATVTVNTTTGEAGTTEIQGTIDNAQQTDIDPTTTGTGVSQCGQAKGAGAGATASTPAGNCSDAALLVVTTASPSPSPSQTTPPTNRPVLSTSTPDIQPNIQGILNASNLNTNTVYELRCYSRPSTTYFTARSASTSAGTTLEFRILPGTNTRCYVRPAGNEALASNSVVINVHTTLSLSTVRTGIRTYIFQGRNLPRRSGQLITLYRIANGQEIRTSNLVTDASGIYRVTRTFTGTGTFQFRVRTSQTLTNAPGASNIITVNIH